jgi:hypothetical protein
VSSPSDEDGLGVSSLPDGEGDGPKGEGPFVELAVILRNNGEGEGPFVELAVILWNSSEGENDDTFV